MAFKTRRQRRYDILRKSGFLPFEARTMSRVPFRVPYMDVMIKERFKGFDEALAKGVSRTGWEKIIKNFYIGNNWRKRTRLGRMKYDPWQMLRDFESKFRAKHPEYESPWEKRRRSWRDFVNKLEKTYQKYPKGMPEVKLRYKPEGGAEIIE